MTHDALVSADLVVDDLDASIRHGMAALGLIDQSAWISPGRGRGCDVLFGQVHPSLAIAPTRLELLAPGPTSPEFPTDQLYYVPELAEQQGQRPIKTHATVIATDDIEGVIERCRRDGRRVRVNPATAALPFPRLFIGFAATAPSTYLPEEDGGIYLEFVATPMVLPPAALAASTAVASPNGAAMTRIVSRGFLVQDLDAALRALSRSFDLEPTEIDAVVDEGCRRAAFEFAVNQSARLELLEPVGDGDAARFAAGWGPGPWHIGIEVDDLDAKVEDLAARGTSTVELPEGPGRPLRTVRARPGGPLGGAVFDFTGGPS